MSLTNTERCNVRGQVLANAAVEMSCGERDVDALAMANAVVALVVAITEVAAHSHDPDSIVRKAIDILSRADFSNHHHCDESSARAEQAS